MHLVPTINDLAVLDSLQTIIRARFPKFRVAYKAESFWQRVVGLMLAPFNPSYMSGMATTIGHTVWVPSREWFATSPGRSWRLLAHEYVHMCDAQRDGGLRFAIRYLWPQPVALLGLLGLLGLLWWPLWGLGVLAFVLRMPASYRLDYEIRGYAANFAADWWSGYSVTFSEISVLGDWLSGSTYLWAARNGDVARARLGAALQSVQSGTIVDGEGRVPFLDIAEAMSRAKAMVRPMRPVMPALTRFTE